MYKGVFKKDCIGTDFQAMVSEMFLILFFQFINIVALSASNRLRELENQLLTLEASKPSAPPALKFKVRCSIM